MSVSLTPPQLEPEPQMQHFPTPVMLYAEPMEFWAFLENSDFQRRKGDTLYRQDEVKLIRHDEFLERDYQMLVDIGTTGVRDAARWYITHPAKEQFDWTWMDRMVAAAEQSGLKLYLDLWHYGYPDWMDLMSPDAPAHFAEFARQLARRYPQIHSWCIANEPSLMVELAGRIGRWRPFQRRKDVTAFRQQICRMIIAGSRAVREVLPNALLVLPEPWHATDRNPESNQAAVIDTVLGQRDAQLGGSTDLIDIIGLNHYRDSTLPPLHRLIMNARMRWTDKTLWITETSGPPRGWKQTEWFWWMMAEVRLANLAGVHTPVFTWAPAISMYDWVDETLQLYNGVWVINEETGEREPNGYMIEAIQLARQYGYLK